MYISEYLYQFRFSQLPVIWSFFRVCHVAMQYKSVVKRVNSGAKISVEVRGEIWNANLNLYREISSPNLNNVFITKFELLFC